MTDSDMLETLRQRINELEAAAPQHESQWQPIETAPKDCNIILFGRWWSDEQGWMKEPVIGRWNQKTDGRWEFANAGGWWGIRPTVWTPLPQHPDTIKVPRPEGHDSWSIEIKTAFGGGGGGGSCPDTGGTTSQIPDRSNSALWGDHVFGVDPLGA